METTKNITVVLSISLFLTSLVAPSQLTAQGWSSSTIFPGQGATSRIAGVHISIDEKAFVGLGLSLSNPYTLYKDFWMYNSISNTWTQLQDFPGEPRYDAVAFAIGSKIYVGGGDLVVKDAELNTGTYTNDFYVFDTQAGTWSAIPNFPDNRGEAVAFTINGKGYVACGKTSNGTNRNELYCFDPNILIWTRKADLPSNGRSYPIGFAINNKGYVGGGYTGSWVFSSGLKPSLYNDFWRYDPNLDQWISIGQTQNGVESSGKIAQAIAITACDKVYLISGRYNGEFGFPQCCSSTVNEYDPTTNLWASKAPLLLV